MIRAKQIFYDTQVPQKVLLVGTPILLSAILILVSLKSFLLFHTLAELFAIVIALIMSVVAWQMYPFTRNNFLMFLGCGYFWIGVLDLLHALTYKGMGVLPDVVETAVSIDFWVATRFLEAFILLIAPLFLERTLARNMTSAIFGVIAVSIIVIVMSGRFPATFVEDEGLTAFKIYSEYLIVFIILSAIYFLWRKRELVDIRIFQLMIVSMLLTVGAELAFTFYISLYGFSNLVGHIFKIFSFWLIYVAVIQTTLRDPFSALSRSASTYDAIPDSVLAIDNEGIIHQANRAAENLSGLPASALIDNQSHNLFHPDDVEKDQCPICLAVKQNIPLDNLQLFWPQRNIWLDYSLAPIQTNIVAYSGMVHTIRNVTKQREDRNALAKLNTLFNSIIENMPMMLFVKEGVENRYIEWNKAAEEITGLSRDKALGKNDYDFWPKEDAEFFIKKDQEILQSQKMQEIPEETIHTLDKGQRWLRTKKIPISDEYGNPQYILGISEDITEKKKVEKELLEYRDQLEELVKQRTATLELAYEDLKLARDEAVRATNIKSEFLANMSHELRTPLNSIIGFTGVVKDEVAGPLNHEQKKQLSMAYDSARHLLSLINDILDISKIEAGEVEVVKQEFDYTKLLDDTIELISPLVIQKGLTISLDSECSSLPICSDRGKIKQVLINLLSNALKFTRQGNIAITCRDQGQTIITTITDTGEGIKAEYLQVIFDAFKQIDSGDIRPHQGTGLGLAICKNFMELLGGSISVVSTEGEGSRFTIELPKGR